MVWTESTTKSAGPSGGAGQRTGLVWGATMLWDEDSPTVAAPAKPKQQVSRAALPPTATLLAATVNPFASILQARRAS